MKAARWIAYRYPDAAFALLLVGVGVVTVACWAAGFDDRARPPH